MGVTTSASGPLLGTTAPTQLLGTRSQLQPQHHQQMLADQWQQQIAAANAIAAAPTQSTGSKQFAGAAPVQSLGSQQFPRQVVTAQSPSGDWKPSLHDGRVASQSLGVHQFGSQGVVQP